MSTKGVATIRHRPTDQLPDPLTRSTGNTGRRRDIQGLRAVAVVVVVLFHAEVGLPGGFVGVDVFFVISGYVITGMLLRERERTGRIRFGAFYLRRFKRLTPALALVVLVSALVSGWLLSPLGPQQTAARTGIGAMLISANFVISHATGGYFDAPAAANPLLHTWSLSVEEQFYLVFPLLLAVGWAYAARQPSRRNLPVVLVATVAIASFALTFVGLHAELVGWRDALVGFYGPVTRAWEFAVGALVVLVLARAGRPSRGAAAALGLAGAAALVGSLFVIAETTPFPGPWTLLPVGATAALLVAGSRPGNPVSRVLGVRPMVLVGDWSYSIYLWHWPAIVFAHVLWPGDATAVALAALLSLLPALASYYWLERPVRRLRALDRRALAGLVTAVVVPGLVGSGGMLVYAEQVGSPRLTADPRGDEYVGEVAWRDHDYRFGGFEPCASTVLREMAESAPAYEPRCQQSRPGPDVDVALVGDSHVEHLFIGLSEAMPDLTIMYFTANAPADLANPQYRAAVDFVAATPSIRTVVVTTYWHARGVQEPQLTAMLEALSAPGRAVLVTDDVPDFPFDPFGCKYGPQAPGPDQCTEDAAAFWAGYQPLVDQLGAVVARVPGSRLVQTARYLCDDTVCSMTRGDEILYADPSHLNVLGSEYVGARMVADNPDLFYVGS